MLLVFFEENAYARPFGRRFAFYLEVQPHGNKGNGVIYSGQYTAEYD